MHVIRRPIRSGEILHLLTLIHATFLLQTPSCKFESTCLLRLVLVWKGDTPRLSFPSVVSIMYPEKEEGSPHPTVGHRLHVCSVLSIKK
jgi:hypothetical protein